jgi:GNAT superfamily N-acetyltransferase
VKKTIELSCVVEQDVITHEAIKPFDLSWDGRSSKTIKTFDPPPGEWGIGLIVGGSGTGKSTLLRTMFGQEEQFEWGKDRSIASHFANATDALERFGAVGLNSVPTWTKPFYVLSNGERFRCDLARRIKSGAAIDEFTSVVDRDVARAGCVAIRRYVDSKGLCRVVFASCHRDIIEWLMPDWVYDTDAGELFDRGFLPARPPITISVVRCGRFWWRRFAEHHYLSHDINPTSRCWVAKWEQSVVGFAASIAMPCGSVMNAYRGHRTVILPEFQGLGIGVRLSNLIASIHKAEGLRYFSRTTHPRMGQYRQAHPELWRPTSKNLKLRTDAKKKAEAGVPAYNGYRLDFSRLCWSHEYVGPATEAA